jgi:hypothetical protein
VSIEITGRENLNVFADFSQVSLGIVEADSLHSYTTILP